MFKYLLIAIFLMPITGFSQENNLGNWLIYIGNKKLDNQWNVHHEVQYRNYNVIGDLEQLLLRTGVGKNLTDGNNNLLLGYGFIRSENYFNETDKSLSKKVNSALENGMKIIFCFGEELQDRKANTHQIVVKDQIQNALFHLETSAFQNIILAYEPVWAIGTGETASPEQAQEMHYFIRNTLANQYNRSMADNVSILYGGSVKPSNAKEIFSKQDVDGGLIGGAALNAEDFFAIVNAIS